jgi:hypothetical protein
MSRHSDSHRLINVFRNACIELLSERLCVICVSFGAKKIMQLVAGV